MNIVDLVIIGIVLIFLVLAIRKLIDNYKCIDKGGGCAGCALSGNCHKEQLKMKTTKREHI